MPTLQSDPPVASVFKPATADTLELLQRFHHERRCSFLTSSN